MVAFGILDVFIKVFFASVFSEKILLQNPQITTTTIRENPAKSRKKNNDSKSLILYRVYL